MQPTFRLLPWAISPTHCTTRTQLTIIDSIGQRRLRQYMLHCIRPRLRYYKYKRSYSFNPQSRFPNHSAESTGGLHRSNGILSRTSKTLTPWLADRQSGSAATGNRTLDPRMRRDDHRTALLSHTRNATTIISKLNNFAEVLSVRVHV